MYESIVISMSCAWHRGCTRDLSQGDFDMQLKALITTLVLGSSSIAMAHPVSAPVPAPVIRDHRAPAPISDDCGPAIQPMPPQPAPVYQPVYRPMPPQPAPVYQRPVYHH